MTNRSLVRSSVLLIIAAAQLSVSTVAGSPNQKPNQRTAASLLNAGQGIADAGVVLRKKADVQSASPQEAPPSVGAPVGAPRRSAPRPMPKHASEPVDNKKTNKDGSFSFENVTAGTYNLTFDAPKVSPAMAGKVEYLVIVQEVKAGGANRSITYDDTKAKTARIPIAKINDGFDFTVGPIPPPPGTGVSKSNHQNSPAVTDSQRSLRGKIFLVEIGTTKKYVDPKLPH
jgi:hypothetical protein